MAESDLLERTPVRSYRSFFDKTPYGEFAGKTILPIASTLLGLCFIIIFNRRNSPEEDPESTPAKILRYLDEHPGSRQHQIAAGSRKSRGAVAYQLHRLVRERKLNTTDGQKSIRYYPSQTDKHSLNTAVLSALQDPYQREILNILHQYPRITRPDRKNSGEISRHHLMAYLQP